MDPIRFDAFTRRLSMPRSRRRLLAHAAGLFGLIGAAGASPAGARHHRHHHHRHHRVDTAGTCDVTTTPCGFPDCNNRSGCSCWVRATGGVFCGSGVGVCATCQSDADCIASQGKGAACVSFADGGAICGTTCSPSLRACIPACAPPL